MKQQQEFQEQEMIKKMPVGMKKKHGTAGQEVGLALRVMGSWKVIKAMPLPKAKARAKAEAHAGHVVDLTNNGSAQKDQEREKVQDQRAKAKARAQEERAHHGQPCGAGHAISQVTSPGIARKVQERE